MNRWKTLFNCLCILLIVASCNNKPEPYILKGTALNYEGDSLYVQLPVGGSFFYRINGKKVPVDNNGAFEFILDTSEPGFAIISHSKTRSLISTWLEPGGVDSIVIDFSKSKELSFFGDHKEANKLYNSFERFPYFHGFGGKEERFQKDSIPTRVYETIMAINEREVEQVQELLKDGKVSKDYAEAIMLDSEYHWKSTFSATAWRHYYYKNILERESFFNDEWMALYEGVFEDTDLNNEKGRVSKYFWTLAQDFVGLYKSGVKNTEEPDTTLSPAENANKYHEKRLEAIENSFQGANKELVWANYLFNGAIQKQFERSLLASYDEFKKEYSESPYDPVLLQYIEPIREYHARLESKMSDDIILIENSTDFTTWGEIIDPYKGEILYVDLWATWCGPCKAEFEHKEGLYEFIKDKPIKVLYVSSDRDDYDQKWKDMINFYGLKGINMRINDDLHWDLWEIIHGERGGAIPRYLIIDREGNMVEKDAARPSSGQKLYDQLAKYL